MLYHIVIIEKFTERKLAVSRIVSEEMGDKFISKFNDYFSTFGYTDIDMYLEEVEEEEEEEEE